MAEWVILILFLLLTFGAYTFNQRYYESQTLLVWGVAAFIMSVSVLIYIFAKVQSASQPWADRYEIDENG